MNILNRFFLAIDSDLEFKLAWERLGHLKNGHKFDGSEKIDCLKSENHPHTNNEYIFTINIRKCECGLIFFDNGLELRK